MPKHILYLCYWFPPAEVIGASRPFEQVKYFLSQGYKVTVICGKFNEDINNTEVLQHPMLRIIRYSNAIANILNRKSKVDNLLPIRAIRFGVQKILYPDEILTSRSNILNIVKDLNNSDSIPDVIISSSLPFSIHTIASEISKQYNINWIADQRDLWSQSPYRKTLKTLRKIDSMYERSVLKNASFNTVVGNKMRNHFKETSGLDNIIVIRNGADTEKVLNESDLQSDKIVYSYTGILYNGLRSPDELFEAISRNPKLAKDSIVNFYGSEKHIVQEYEKRYKTIKINYNSRKPKCEIKEIQKKSHFLIIALGRSEFEKSVLTGKFYEYLETGRPIIALCDEDSELGILINNYRIGIATRDSVKIQDYITYCIEKDFPLITLPYDLTRKYQNEQLLKIINKCL